jgi:hypothetical protein
MTLVICEMHGLSCRTAIRTFGWLRRFRSFDLQRTESLSGLCMHAPRGVFDLDMRPRRTLVRGGRRASRQRRAMNHEDEDGGGRRSGRHVRQPSDTLAHPVLVNDYPSNLPYLRLPRARSSLRTPPLTNCLLLLPLLLHYHLRLYLSQHPERAMKIEMVVDLARANQPASLATRVAAAPAADGNAGRTRFVDNRLHLSIILIRCFHSGTATRGRGRGRGGARTSNTRAPKSAADLDAEMEVQLCYARVPSLPVADECCRTTLRATRTALLLRPRLRLRLEGHSMMSALFRKTSFPSLASYMLYHVHLTEFSNILYS